MFSYRHAFHAGNHADVLKHAILLHTLDYFNRKDNPYCVIDTHAGAGVYDLRDEWAMQNGEFAEGIDRLLGAPDLPPMLQRYVEAVAHFNPDGFANFYPGSPWLALSTMREYDRLRLFEMHPTEVEALRHNLQTQDREAVQQTTIYEADGFNGLKSQLPPTTRRAITIIDPSYEDKHDYRHTLNALNEGLRRFATGCYLIWYPLVQRREATEMARAFERMKVPWVSASLTVRKPSADGYGLHGSGMFVVNPPWTLYRELQAAMPWLKEKLKQDDRASFSLKQHGN